jgi:hypothetical protein
MKITAVLSMSLIIVMLISCSSCGISKVQCQTGDNRDAISSVTEPVPPIFVVPPTDAKPTLDTGVPWIPEYRSYTKAELETQIKAYWDAQNVDHNYTLSGIENELYRRCAPFRQTKLASSIFSDSANSDAAENNTQPCQPLTYSGTACVIIAIWDYPYAPDLYYNQYAYECVYDGVINVGYTDCISLVNSDATCGNVWQSIAVFCSWYSYVDVYVYGHGDNFYGGFVGYDADTWYGANPFAEFYPLDLLSYYYHNYDFTSLRLGVFGSCYGACFGTCFLNPNSEYPIPQKRCFLASSDEVYDSYNENFAMWWSYYWYYFETDSYEAWATAYTYALWSAYGMGTYDYSDSNGYSIYWDFNWN